tara:strand:- start:11187 stop:12404 length:1218 start_codon:yes stop_codon:yes gene_type:complete
MGWKDNWFIDDTTKQLDSLNRISGDTTGVDTSLGGGLESYRKSFGLDPFGSTGDTTVADTGTGDEGRVEPREETSDYLIPAIAIGAGELLGLAKKMPGMPESFKAFGHKATRLSGSKSLAFMLATHAADAGSILGRKFLESIPGGEGRGGLEKKYIDIGTGIAGGGAAWGTYKGLPALTNLITKHVKTGMAHHVLPKLVEEAGVAAYKTVIDAGAPGAYKGKTVVKQVMEKTPGFKKGTTTGKLRKHPQLKPVKTIVPSALEKKAVLASTKASQVVEKELVESLSKHIGEKGTKTWAQINARLLKNPNVALKLGKFLGNRMPGLALKLTAGTAGLVFPEWMSSVAGGIALVSAGLDLYNASQYIPGIMDMIFEDDPVASEEDQLIDNFIEEDRRDYFMQQRLPKE